MTNLSQREIDEINETGSAMMQLRSLERIRVFLIEHNSDKELRESIDIAIEDIDRHIDPEIANVLRSPVRDAWKMSSVFEKKGTDTKR